MPTGRPLARRRDGFALLLALGAIVVISALVAGSFMISTRDVRTARVVASRESAQLRAENALFQLREDAQVQAAGLSDVGATVRWTPPYGGGEARMTKLSDNMFLLTSSATAGGQTADNGAQSRVSMLLMRNVPQMEFMGALTARGKTKIGGSSYINGHDTNPPGWSCPAPGETKPGVVTPNTGDITYAGCNGGQCIDGDPDVLQSSRAADDATYFQYGNTGWNDLKALAMKIPGNMGPMYVAPTYKADGTCDTGNIENWGDPLRIGGACEGYFPIIYVDGDATINRLRGQGVLLVEGDLEVQGAYEFYGPVIVKGRLKTTGTGGHFNGGVMAANVELDQNQVTGNAVVNYSSCAIATALRNATPLAPVRQRAWADLY